MGTETLRREPVGLDARLGVVGDRDRVVAAGLRVATPREVAEMIAFLASEESSGVSGEAIRVALGSVW